MAAPMDEAANIAHEGQSDSRRVTAMRSATSGIGKAPPTALAEHGTVEQKSRRAMMNYVRVSPEQVPLGTTALVLFIDHGQLCAGVIEHCRDGRLERRVPEAPMPEDVVPVICRLMAEQPGDAGPVYVVIENQAFWPELLPVLQNYGPGGARPAL